MKNFNPSLQDDDADQAARKMYQETKGNRLYELNDRGKHLSKILDENIDSNDPVPFKDLKKLNIAKHFLDYNMESYGNLDNLILNENGEALVRDLISISISEENKIKLEDLRRICNDYVKKFTKFKPNVPFVPDKTDYSHLVKHKGS